MASNLNPEQLEALLNGPALKPPPGVVPQLDNPPAYRTASTALPVVCLVVATLGLAMRLYTRIRVLRQVNLADYSILVGWAVFVAYFGMAIMVGNYGPGVHQWDLRLRDLGPFLYYIHNGSILYGICIFFIKLSILLQYMQIFMPVREPVAMWWTCVFLIGANFIFYLVSTFLEIFACQPIEKAWDPLVTEGRCIDILRLNVIASSVNTVSDVTILVLPQLIIWRLNTSWRVRSGISLIFLIAAFACASAAVRLYYAVLLQHSTDITYYSWFAGAWTLPEISLGIVVGCLSVTRAFFHNTGQSRVLSTVAMSLRNWTNRQGSRSGFGFGSGSTSGGRTAARGGKDMDGIVIAAPSADSFQVPQEQGQGGSQWVRAYGLERLTALEAEPDEEARGIWTGGHGGGGVGKKDGGMRDVHVELRDMSHAA